MKFLVVDDSPFMRQAVIKSLKETKFGSGAAVSEAGDGEEALKHFKKGDLDVVLCDWNMPKMNGLQFVIEARKIKTPKHVPIIMVTTEGTLEKMGEALEKGADRYVVKPFSAKDLESSLERVAK